jgi:hypothetical protein
MKTLGRIAVLGVIVGVLLSSCADSASTSTTRNEVSGADTAGCADVIDVVVSAEEQGTYRFAVTVRSADTGWDKYADRWEVRDGSGRVLGERVLAHPHVEEQPFTRSQSGIEIPAGVTTVTVMARDSTAGFCGASYEVAVP